MTGVQTAALEHFSVRALDRHPQYPWHSRDAVVREADNQPLITGVVVAPDERRSHPIANSATDPVERCRIRLVVAHQILCADLVKVPERPVIRPDIDYVSDHILCRRYTFIRSARIESFPRKTLLEQCGDPRRAIAERFNLLVLNKDGIAPNPIIAADCAIYQF